MSEQPGSDDVRQAETKRRKVLRTAAKLAWVVPAVIAAVEMADLEVSAQYDPRKVTR